MEKCISVRCVLDERVDFGWILAKVQSKSVVKFELTIFKENSVILYLGPMSFGGYNLD
jgi:hypothetical protein